MKGFDNHEKLTSCQHWGIKLVIDKTFRTLIERKILQKEK